MIRLPILFLIFFNAIPPLGAVNWHLLAEKAPREYLALVYSRLLDLPTIQELRLLNMLNEWEKKALNETLSQVEGWSVIVDELIRQPWIEVAIHVQEKTGSITFIFNQDFWKFQRNIKNSPGLLQKFINQRVGNVPPFSVTINSDGSRMYSWLWSKLKSQDQSYFLNQIKNFKEDDLLKNFKIVFLNLTLYPNQGRTNISVSRMLDAATCSRLSKLTELFISYCLFFQSSQNIHNQWIHLNLPLSIFLDNLARRVAWEFYFEYLFQLKKIRWHNQRRYSLIYPYAER
ncbi:MAG: hypothetical protein RMK80_08515 [Pseudobdellovibrionaceae bacterium]|nr:hypothetical protein [Pseudobdellovibrionaceae bacterium]